MIEPANVIFYLENAEEYGCQICLYGQERGEMYVEVAHEEKDTFCYCFVGVRYFAGTMGWRSAKFNLETDDKCRSLLENAGWSRQVADFFIQRKQCYLLTVNSPNRDSTKIVASAVDKIAMPYLMLMAANQKLITHSR